MSTPATRSLAFRMLRGVGMLVCGTALVFGMAAALSPSLRTTMAEGFEQIKLKPAPINGDRAYGYLKAICKIGPRPAGSAANTKQRQMVADHFAKYGATVREQPFQAVDPLSNAPVTMVNLIGSWFPERTERVVIGVHYDTRPFPDEDPDPANRKIPFIGANDGASGVALLMEIAPPPQGLAHPLGDRPRPLRRRGACLWFQAPDRRLFPGLQGLRPRVRRVQEKQVPLRPRDGPGHGRRQQSDDRHRAR